MRIYHLIGGNHHGKSTRQCDKSCNGLNRGKTPQFLLALLIKPPDGLPHTHHSLLAQCAVLFGLQMIYGLQSIPLGDGLTELNTDLTTNLGGRHVKIKMVEIQGGTSTTFDILNAERGMIFISSTVDNLTGILSFSASSGGVLSYKWVAEANLISVSKDTNTFTISNTGASYMTAIMVSGHFLSW